MTTAKKEWYERTRPFGFRVWNGHAFTDECSIVMGQEGVEIIGLGIDSTMAKFQAGTGCHDSAGHEIFEGDYLMTDEGDWIGVVVYGNGYFLCEDKHGGFSGAINWENGLVVGNVFEGIDEVMVAEEKVRRNRMGMNNWIQRKQQ